MRHPVAHQLPGQVGQRRPGQDHQVRNGAIVARPDLGRGALDGAGRPLLPRLAEVGQHKPGGREVGGLGGFRVGAADVPDAGGGQEAGHARAGPACPVHPDVGGPPPGQRARPAVPVRVGQRRGGQLGGQPGAQLLGQRGVHAGRKVVEHARRGQHREHPRRRRRRHAVALRGGDHALLVAAPVEQAEHGRSLAEPGHRDRPPRIHAELQRVAVPPHRQQPRLQCWSHAVTMPPPTDIPPRHVLLNR